MIDHNTSFKGVYMENDPQIIPFTPSYLEHWKNNLIYNTPSLLMIRDNLPVWKKKKDFIFILIQKKKKKKKKKKTAQLLRLAS